MSRPVNLEAPLWAVLLLGLSLAGWGAWAVERALLALVHRFRRR